LRKQLVTSLMIQLEINHLLSGEGFVREVQRNPDSRGEKVIVKFFVKLMFSGTFLVQRLVLLASIQYGDPRLDCGR